MTRDPEKVKAAIAACLREMPLEVGAQDVATAIAVLADALIDDWAPEGTLELVFSVALESIKNRRRNNTKRNKMN